MADHPPTHPPTQLAPVLCLQLRRPGGPPLLRGRPLRGPLGARLVGPPPRGRLRLLQPLLPAEFHGGALRGSARLHGAAAKSEEAQGAVFARPCVGLSGRGGVGAGRAPRTHAWVRQAGARRRHGGSQPWHLARLRIGPWVARPLPPFWRSPRSGGVAPSVGCLCLCVCLSGGSAPRARLEPRARGCAPKLVYHEHPPAAARVRGGPWRPRRRRPFLSKYKFKSNKLGTAVPEAHGPGSASAAAAAAPTY